MGLNGQGYRKRPVVLEVVLGALQRSTSAEKIGGLHEGTQYEWGYEKLVGKDKTIESEGFTTR